MIKGIKIFNLTKIGKSQNLIVGELNKNYNFKCKRFFFIIGKKNELRGYHAHKRQIQFMVCLQGACKLEFDNGFKKEQFILKNNSKAIMVSAKIWGVQKYLKDNTILLVLSNGFYNEKEYIRKYSEFKKIIKNK